MNLTKIIKDEEIIKQDKHLPHPFKKIDEYIIELYDKYGLDMYGRPNDKSGIY